MHESSFVFSPKGLFVFTFRISNGLMHGWVERRTSVPNEAIVDGLGLIPEDSSEKYQHNFNPLCRYGSPASVIPTIITCIFEREHEMY